MPDINEVRRRFRLALAILLAVSVAAAGVLLSPIGNSGRTRQQQLEQLQTELQVKSAANKPLLGIDRKLEDAQGEIASFFENRLPSSYASISERLGAIASENGVSLATGHYKAEPSGVPGLELMIIQASITGDYLHAVKFINATEREKMFLVIDGVSLTQQQGGTVQLQIRIEAFRKEA
jgi:hypothetical protein